MFWPVKNVGQNIVILHQNWISVFFLVIGFKRKVLWGFFFFALISSFNVIVKEIFLFGATEKR